MAYDWGDWELQPGTTPTHSVRHPVHRNFIINSLRWLHCTQLRWIHAYDASDPLAQAGAEEIQRVMGYRFVMEEVGFTPKIVDGNLRVTMNVRNEGAAPFYYPWPLQVALLDLITRRPVFRRNFESVDIRSWLGGEGWTQPDWMPVDHWSRNIIKDHWADTALEYEIPPPTHQVDESFTVNLPAGRYILAISILDPANGEPNLRFATSWYLNGGWHPVGIVGIGDAEGSALPAGFEFNDPHTDYSISYAP